MKPVLSVGAVTTTGSLVEGYHSQATNQLSTHYFQCSELSNVLTPGK